MGFRLANTATLAPARSPGSKRGSKCQTKPTAQKAQTKLIRTSFSTTDRTIVPCHCCHNHDRRGWNCFITGLPLMVDVAASTNSFNSFDVTRHPIHGSPPLIATGTDGSNSGFVGGGDGGCSGGLFLKLSRGIGIRSPREDTTTSSKVRTTDPGRRRHILLGFQQQKIGPALNRSTPTGGFLRLAVTNEPSFVSFGEIRKEPSSSTRDAARGDGGTDGHLRSLLLGSVLQRTTWWLFLL
mmetsp:Transcript_19726/g.63426  ORF Transcript_19726/g.63426 Transcript_19726/m.63426 type:complete len:239 (-) Transcript_19726:858-1574(-)